MRALALALALVASPAVAGEVYGPPEPVLYDVAPGIQSDEPGPLIYNPPPSPDQRKAFRNREIAYHVLGAMDAATTCHAISSGQAVEGNPAAAALIGRRPSCGKVIAFKLAGSVVHHFIATKFFDQSVEKARQFQIVSLVIQGAVVGANMRFVF